MLMVCALGALTRLRGAEVRRKSRGAVTPLPGISGLGALLGDLKVKQNFEKNSVGENFDDFWTKI